MTISDMIATNSVPDIFLFALPKMQKKTISPTGCSMI